MSSESLSQNEIDLLFSGGGAVPTAPTGPVDPSREVQVYDFTRPARVSKDRKRSLMAMYGLLAKSLESWLGGRVRDSIELELQSVEQLSFGEFTLALPSPCSSYIVDVGNGGQQGVIDFGHDLAFFLVDRLLGGAGRHVTPARSLTQLERQVVRVVADRMAHQLGDVWADYVRLELSVSGFESIPEMLQVANREDPVLVANIGVTIGDVSSLLLMCLPFAALEKFFTGTSSRRGQQAQGTSEERRHDRRVIEGSLHASRVTVDARLPSFSASLGELATLRPGSVLSTGLSTTTPLEVHIAGQRRFTASAGRSGQNMAVRVETAVEPRPEHVIEPGREGDVVFAR